MHDRKYNEAVCDILNKNGPYRFIILNSLSVLDGTLKERIGAMSLLSSVCHWQLPLRFQKASVIPVCPLCLVFVNQDMRSQLSLPI